MKITLFTLHIIYVYMYTGESLLHMMLNLIKIAPLKGHEQPSPLTRRQQWCHAVQTARCRALRGPDRPWTCQRGFRTTESSTATVVRGSGALRGPEVCPSSVPGLRCTKWQLSFSVSSNALNFYESVFILDLIIFNIFFELYILYFTDFWPRLYNILVSYVGPFLEGSKLKRTIFKIRICRYMDKVWQADNICNIVV